MVNGSNVVAQLIDETSAYITATSDATFSVSISVKGQAEPACLDNQSIKKDKSIRVYLNENGEVHAESVSFPSVTTTDYTSRIVNPSFDGNAKNGWEGTSLAVDYSEAEIFNKTYDFYQTITDLPAGQYELTCQGFYRNGGYADAAKNRTAGKEALNAILYANDSTVALVSIFEDAGKKGAVGVNQSPYGYIPNNMEQAAIYLRAGLYKNSLLCEVGDDGKLKIGVKKTVAVGNDWSIFDNFTLTYLGNPNIPDALDRVQISQPVSAFEGIYTLQGTKVNALSNINKGIYVMNGQKVLVR